MPIRTSYIMMSALMLLCVLLYFVERPSLVFDADAIRQGQYWRLWTGHLLHTNGWHLVMNLAALAIITLLHGAYYRLHRLLIVVGLGFPAISMGLLWLSPELKQYVGLSGFLHALVVWGACIDIQRHITSGWLILGGAIAKVGYEQWHGADSNIAALIEAPVAIDAHLVGVATGILLYAMTSTDLLYRFYRRRQPPP